MTILRIIIENDAFIDNRWFLINGQENLGSGVANIPDILALEGFTQIEVYLSPNLASIFKVDVAHINDKKINDSLLLSFVEDYLVDDIENCKPLLMRLSDGESYVAVLNLDFYNLLIKYFTEHIKQILFIQPIPYAIDYKEDIWTICLTKEYKFIRTSQFEYFLLDDSNSIPDVLKFMLETYPQDNIIIYCDDDNIVNNIESDYKLLCQRNSMLNYGNLVWNFYNEKSKRFNYKFTADNKQSLYKSLKIFIAMFIVYAIFWIVGFGYLLVDKYRLEKQITQSLSGIVKIDSVQSNLLEKINNQLDGLAHTKGYYSSQDFVFLLVTFLENMPEINQGMIVGIKFSGNSLDIFLNSQFQNKDIENYVEILKTKKINMTVNDYNSYQSDEQSNNKNNNGGGILDDTKSNDIQNAQWVISIHEIRVLDLK